MKLGSVTVGGVFKGILVEVEYCPGVVPNNCWGILLEFMQVGEQRRERKPSIHKTPDQGFLGSCLPPIPVNPPPIVIPLPYSLCSGILGQLRPTSSTSFPRRQRERHLLASRHGSLVLASQFILLPTCKHSHLESIAITGRAVSGPFQQVPAGRWCEAVGAGNCLKIETLDCCRN